MNPKPQKTYAKKSPSIFVKALAPVNPSRWAAFAAGSAMASDMPDIRDKLQTPFFNLVVAKEYLETSLCDVQYRDRLWKIAEDTATINLSSELGGDVGSFGAGAVSNQIANKYMNEMVMTEATKNTQEELNLEMFKEIARQQGANDSNVRGTGVRREYVPKFMKQDVCERPERNSRPNPWEDTSSPYDDESFFN